MNEPNYVENLLHSWTPRRPSGHLRERLFSSVDEPSRVSWKWLMPATIGVFSLLLILGNGAHPAGRLGAPDTNLFFGVRYPSGCRCFP